MRFNWKLPVIAGTFLVSSLLGYSQTQEKGQNKSAFVDSVMNETEKYPTTTHFMYEIMKDSENNFHDVNKLEKIIENVEKQYNKKEKYSKEEVIEILKTTHREINNLGLEYEIHKFDCSDMSFIYLAVGEKFNLNLFGVRAPGHMFIRYGSLESTDIVNKGDFNWETTENELYSDKDYIGLLTIQRESIEKNLYMKNLTKQELIAIAYADRGKWEEKNKNYDLAIKDYNKSIELNPNSSETYRNRGHPFFYKKDYAAAIENFSKAIELESNFSEAYYCRGVTYERIGNFEKANADFKKAKEFKNDFFYKDENN